jgi:nucleoporin NUP82
LAVFESVDLGIAATLRRSGRGLQELNENWMLFQVDPLYPDTVYIYHSLGLQSLRMGEWLEAITEVMEKDPQDQDAVTAVLEGVNPTTVEWVVDTFTGMERCVQ